MNALQILVFCYEVVGTEYWLFQIWKWSVKGCSILQNFVYIPAVNVNALSSRKKILIHNC